MASRRPYQLAPGTCLEVRSPGGEVGRCEVLSPLDHGTNSQAYLAVSAAGQHLVLKASRWVEPGQIDADLQIEAEILRQVTSDALIRLLGSATGPEGKLVLAFERAFTNPLLIISRPEVRRHFPDAGTRFVPLPVQLTLQLGCDLLRAIGQMHLQGFVHHDVKVANLMVRVPETGRAVPDARVLAHALAGRARGVLIDAGASRSMSWLADLEAGRAAADVSVVPPQLTPLYAPPEALLEGHGGRRRLHPSLDLYAAGVVLYACASGRLPYDEHGVDTDRWEDLLQAKQAEQEGQLRPISRQALRAAPGYRAVADELHDVLAALLNRDPERRPRPRDARTHLERLLAALPPL